MVEHRRTYHCSFKSLHEHLCISLDPRRMKSNCIKLWLEKIPVHCQLSSLWDQSKIANWQGNVSFSFSISKECQIATHMLASALSILLLFPIDDRLTSTSLTSVCCQIWRPSRKPNLMIFAENLSKLLT